MILSDTTRRTVSYDSRCAVVVVSGLRRINMHTIRFNLNHELAVNAVSHHILRVKILLLQN